GPDAATDTAKDTAAKPVEKDVARDSQEKPASLVAAQQCQSDSRKNYDSNSSRCLPRVLVHDGLDGTKTVQIAEKVVHYVGGDEKNAPKVMGGDVPPGDIAFGDILPKRAADVVNAYDGASGSKALAGGDPPVRLGTTPVEQNPPVPEQVPAADTPVRVGTTVVEHAPGVLEKDAAAIRKATKRDDYIDLGTDKKAIFQAMEGKTPEQTLALMQI